MRISDRRILPLAMLMLAGCGRSEPAPPARPEAAAGAVAIPCTIGTAAAQRCTVERTRAGDAVVLVLRHPDGGFRRVRVARDGRGVTAADGATPARIRVTGPSEIAVSIEGDTYRLPATLAPATGAAP